MGSITRNRQTMDTLRAMVARAYGTGQVPTDGRDWVGELGPGWFNLVYRIRLRDGRRVVLKVAPPAGVDVLTYERGAMATELVALRLIRQHTMVPVPAVDFADDSRELCDADWFCMEYVDADNLGVIAESLTTAQHEAYREALGAANRQLNEIRGAAFGPITGPGDATWRACFTRMVAEVLGDGERRGVDLGPDYGAVRETVAASAGCLDAVVEPRYVEWDLWDSNVMVRDGRILSIIDHERAFYGDPLMEAGFTGLDLPAFGDPAPFVRGYRHYEFTAGERRRRRLYTLYLLLVMIVETHYRGHTGTGQYDWARARLRELMTAIGEDAR